MRSFIKLKIRLICVSEETAAASFDSLTLRLQLGHDSDTMSAVFSVHFSELTRIRVGHDVRGFQVRAVIWLCALLILYRLVLGLVIARVFPGRAGCPPGRDRERGHMPRDVIPWTEE
jgi:hypothetical protein